MKAKMVAVGTVRVEIHEDRPTSFVEPVESLALNEALSDGWKITHYVQHASSKNDATAVAAVMIKE